MESSSDDDGEAATAIVTKAILLCCIILPFSVYKSSPTKHTQTILAQHRTGSPPTATNKPGKKGNKKKKLYITFDDGPNKGTRNVLHIVQDEGVPVSFFIVGEHVFASPTQARLWDSLKIARQIELCNHSYSHAHSRYESYYAQPDSVVADFRRTHDSLNLANTVARTPGRNIWRIDTLQFTDLKRSAVAADSLQKAGFKLMGWDLEWHFDHKTMCVVTTAEKMVAQIDSVFKHNRTKNKDHLVLLAHDQAYAKSEDSFQLRQFFQLLKQKDYELSLATEYPGAVSDTARLQ
ncbi:MAG TPA: polysaccharide deacetylase family protein [Flavisolibacter sp.]|nr:polysaccharide deacetylase family protein [Flavisolibacter sp.]